MRFQYKIILHFTVLACILSLLVGGLWYLNSKKNSFSQAEQSISFTSEQMAAQFEAFYKDMNQVATQFLSGQEVFEALRVVKAQDEYEQQYASYYISILNNAVITSYNLSNYFRVIYFNDSGTLIYSSMYHSEGVITDTVTPLNRKCLQAADQAHGKAVLLPPHEDGWNPQTRKKVVSMIRSIQGDSLGYIEVQQPQEYLSKIFTPPEKQIHSAVFLPTGEILYASDTDRYSSGKCQAYLSMESGIYSDTDSSQILCVTRFNNDIVLLLTIDFSSIYSSLNQSMLFTILIVFIILFLSIGFIFLAASHLTKPIRYLRRQIDEKQLSDLNTPFSVSGSSDELAALAVSYHDLLVRLTDSMERNQKLAVLQLQAQFDSLQAQINPHFLYNVLNVMANRGVENGDNILCKMCKNLAAMLRYSTDTTERYATVEQEIEYLNHYIYLMKTRYEQYLNISVSVDPEAARKVLPKLTLQQLAENSIRHGFTHIDSDMIISISVKKSMDGWYIQIIDNGEGFSIEALEQIRKSTEEMKGLLQDQSSTINMQIGGMGLTSLYSRLYLVYARQLSFSCSNIWGQGASVEIRIQEEETTHVQSIDRR